MRILGNGKVIYLERGDDMDDMFSLVCVCGHELRSHSFTHAYGRMDKYITSQCVFCGFHKKDKEHPQGFICEQFRVEEGVNDARWFNFPDAELFG